MASVPQKVRRWNWGAFMFSIWWGIGNKSYLPLLCLIPGFNLIWIFVCGAKGNEWAWQNNGEPDPDAFMQIQRTWNRAGFWAFLIGVVLPLILFGLLGALGVFTALHNGARL